MADWELAQLNIALMRAPIDDPVMAAFAARLDEINAIADAAPGFVWRLQDDDGAATSFRPFGDDVLVNMSVWRDVEALKDYVLRSDHAQLLRRRKAWFERMEAAYSVMWWVPAGHRPSLAEAAERLERLRRDGPGSRAFTFRDSFPPPADGLHA
ncbi:MAG: DUF3291 domain-containing protein [Alphaproteobacteria bacterium]